MYSNPQGIGDDEGTPSFDQSAFDELSELNEAIGETEEPILEEEEESSKDDPKLAKYRNDPDYYIENGRAWLTPEAQKRRNEERGLHYFGVPLGQNYDFMKDMLSAPGMGILDTGLGAVNWVLKETGLPEIPEIPRFVHEEANTVRDLSSIVFPTMRLAGGLKAAGTAAHSKIGWSLGNDRSFRFLSNMGINIGSGLIVDEVAPTQERDMNATGSLKAAWPKFWGFIPDNLATLDSDSPDVKREKNKKEGALFGLASDLIPGLAKLYHARQNLKATASWVPENELAKNWTELANKERDITVTPEGEVMRNAERRASQLDALGQYNFEKSVDLDTPNEPVFAYHDVYDDLELGIRTKDPLGIVGASMDNVRIMRNIDSVDGRLGSVMTPSKLQFGIDAPGNTMTVLKELVTDLRNAGEYGYSTAGGRYIPFKHVVEDGNKLAAKLYNMSIPDMKKTLAPLMGEEVNTKAMILNDTAYAAAFKATNDFLADYASMDVARAYAYTATSMAGQISDLAEGARKAFGTSAYERAQDQILDRIQFLATLSAQTTYAQARALNMKNLWNRAKGLIDPKHIEREKNATLRGLADIAENKKAMVETLRAVKAQKPEMLGPLLLAYEMTNGKVDSITKLNNYLVQSTGILSKAIIDRDPQIPSMVMQGVWGTIYNSMFSWATPLVAGTGNAFAQISNPISLMMSSAMAGDKAAMQRGMYMYGQIMDNTRSGLSHMGEVMKKATFDPDSVGYIMRDDIARMNAEKLALLDATAETMMEEGNYGLAVLTENIKTLHALETNPVFRFPANAMTALDGFTLASESSIYAHGMAYDMINASNGALDPDMIADIQKQIYKGTFDENGMITNKAVENTSREIAMNQSNNITNSIDALLASAPGLRPWIMFQRTMISATQWTGSHIGFGLHEKISRWKRPFSQMPRDEVRDLLAEKGMVMEDLPDPEAAYNHWYHIYRGRKALGATIMTSAIGLAMAGRIRGHGHMDPKIQRTREGNNWERNTYLGLDGKWHSFENMGHVTDLLSFVATMWDNHDNLDNPTVSNMLARVMYSLGGAMQSRQFADGLGPLFDIMEQRGGALERWGAQFSNSMMPMSGERNQMARLFHKELRVVNEDFISHWYNRNPVLRDQLPIQYSYVTGKPVGGQSDPWARFFNGLTPWKQSSPLTPEEQYLVDIEWDGRPTLKTDGRGQEFTDEEVSEISRLIGENGIFTRKVKEFMKKFPADKFREGYFDMQREASGDVPVSLYQQVHAQLDQALRAALNSAVEDSSFRDTIRLKQRANNESEDAIKRGDLDALQDAEELLRIAN